jgi:hypothetical protein
MNVYHLEVITGLENVDLENDNIQSGEINIRWPIVLPF